MKKILVALLLCQTINALPVDISIAEISKHYLGLSYVWGGSNPSTGMDCSGYTKYVFKKKGITIPRTAYEQSKVGKSIDKRNLKKGDLLFFLTDIKRNIPITHVGIYLGNGKFIHAASKKRGIIISSFNNGYYSKVFKSAKRIIETSSRLNNNFNVELYKKSIFTSMDVKFIPFGGY